MRNGYEKLWVLMFLLIGGVAHPQTNPIPNPGFENWTAGSPDHWIANNVPGFATPITQSSNAHSGSLAVRGEVVSFAGLPYPPYLQSEKFPVNHRYARLTGFYQFQPQGNDSLGILIILFKNGMGIGGGVSVLGGSTSGYVQFTAPIQYNTSEVPDSAQVFIVVGDTTINAGTIGSYFLMDDLALEGTVGIADVGEPSLPTEFALEQNYPNPFNPATTFRFTLPRAADVQLSVYNLLGQEMARVVEGRFSAGHHEIRWQAGNLPGGVYLYRMTARDAVTGEVFRATRKMVLMK